jgi:hypothetical protein
VNCPWCDVAAGPRALHAHLGEQHGEQVGATERGGKVFYEISCPLCGAQYERLVRKGASDPEFLAEFGTEIRMVAFDMLVHHLIAQHEQAAGRPTVEQQEAHGQNNVSAERETKR